MVGPNGPHPYGPDRREDLAVRCELCATPIPERYAHCPTCSGQEILRRIAELAREAELRLADKAALEAMPRRELCLKVADVYCALGRQEDAVRVLKKAIEHDPHDPEYRRLLATVRARRREYAECLSEMLKAASLAPNFPDYQSDLGAAFFKSGRYEEAAACLARALALNPRYANAHNNLALVLAKLGRVEESEAALREAVRLDPDHAVAHCELGLAYYSGGMFSRMKTEGSVDAKTLGDLYRLQARAHEALEQYETALTLHPEYADLHLACGLCHEALGDRGSARSCYERALEINPAYNEAAQRLKGCA